MSVKAKSSNDVEMMNINQIPTNLLLKLPPEIIFEILHFLTVGDKIVLARTCHYFHNLLARYQSTTLPKRIHFEPTNDHYDIASKFKIIRKKDNSDENLWKLIKCEPPITCCGLFHFRFNVIHDTTDGNGWRVCIGVSGDLSETDPDYGRWSNKNRVAFGINTQSELIGGKPGEMSFDISDGAIKNKLPITNNYFIDLKLDLNRDCSRIFYFHDNKLIGRQILQNINISKGENLWLIVSTSNGSHGIELDTSYA